MEKLKKWIFITLLFVIAFLFVASFLCHSSRFKILNTICLLFGMAGILQLEIAGLFKYLCSDLERIQNETNSDIATSHIVRQIYDMPIKSEHLLDIQYYLFSEKEIGFYLAMIGLVLQIILIWAS